MLLAWLPSTGRGEDHIPGFYGTTQNLVPPAASALPQVRNMVEGITSIEAVTENKLVVRQNKAKAVVDWESFDVGASAWVHFNQKGNANWSALNRIYDQNPSQIFGKLTAR